MTKAEIAAGVPAPTKPMVKADKRLSEQVSQCKNTGNGRLKKTAMQIDDPNGPEFASWRSYQDFARAVRRERRYVWEQEVTAFLDTVLATIRKRGRTISEGSILYRAQHGIVYREDEDGVDILAYGGKRMKPLTDRAKEGRANPAGISMLYLGSSEQTAISEVRPWIGSELSVAQFRISRDVKVIDLSLGHGQTSFQHLFFSELLGEKPVGREKKEEAVWIDIDNAFSRPVTRSDDTADYVPTQILAELFRDNGYDGLVYRSQFGETGFNIGLFDVGDADIINAAPYQVTAIDVKFEEIGNRWFSKKHYDRNASHD